jgi:hypothetical protein
MNMKIFKYMHVIALMHGYMQEKADETMIGLGTRAGVGIGV